MRAAGLCHSDLSVIDGNRPRPLPMVLGHEGAGIVEELGAGVTDLKVGDHVVTAFVPSCGHCGPCETGRPALCEPGAAANSAGTLISGARRLHSRGARRQPSPRRLGLRAITPCARNSVVRIDRRPRFARGRAVRLRGDHRRRRGDQHRRHAAAAQRSRSSASAASASPRCSARACARPHTIVAVDLIAAEAGAGARARRHAHLHAATPNAVEAIREATQGGVEYAFEMAGSVRAMELAYKVTRRGGTTVSAGLSHPQASSPCRTSTSSPRSAPSRAATSAAACPRATSRATSSGTAGQAAGGPAAVRDARARRHQRRIRSARGGRIHPPGGGDRLMAASARRDRTDRVARFRRRIGRRRSGRR